MSREQAVQLRDRLADSGVRLKPVPRGDGNRRGVPDSVIWIEPTGVSVQRLFPILVELEGKLSNVDDFEKFARRDSKKEPYQHHLDFPSLMNVSHEFELHLTYDIAAVGDLFFTSSSTGGMNEPEFHNALREWSKEHESSFQTDARITILNDTRIVWWQISFAISGHHFSTQIPFIVDIGPRFDHNFSLYASRFIIPCVAVITNEDRHAKHQVQHSTSIRFRRLTAIESVD